MLGNFKRDELLPGSSDWILLPQLDSDDEGGMMWDDCGRIYCWVREDDLKAVRFDNCWFILQCY